MRRERRFDERPAMRGHLERSAEQRLRGGRTETDDRLRPHERNLSIQPWTAGRNLRRARLLVDAALASRLPLEVLHDVGDVDIVASDARLGQRLVEQSAGRSDEGMASRSSWSPGCSPTSIRRRRAGPFAEDGLRSGLPQVARPAVARGGANGLEGGPIRNPVSRRRVLAVAACSAAILKFLRRPAFRARVIALFASATRRSASGSCKSSSTCGRSQTLRGNHAGSSLKGAAALYGQTSWQTSQP